MTVTGDHSGGWEEWLEQGAPPPDSGPNPSPPRLTVREYDYGPLDNTDLVPKIVDRSGGSAGPRLRRARAPRGESPNRDKILSVVIMAGVAIVVVSVILTVLHTGKRHHPGMLSQSTYAATPSASPAAQPNAVATPDCQQHRDADVVSGTDPGGTGDGPAAILAFERAYYVQRSGSAARAVVADDSNVNSADEIQRGIDQVPAGTRYCVQITSGSSDGTQWEVRLTEQDPGKPAHTFTQIVTTRTVANHTLITAIKGT